MNRPNTTSAAPSAPSGMATVSPARRSRATLDLADHALDEIAHLLQHDVGLLVRHTGVDDGLARVVLERALEDDELALHHLRLDRVGPLARRLRDRLAVGRRLHDAALEPAAQ